MKLIIGISGASGSIYGFRLIEEMKKAGHHISVIITETGKDVLKMETGRKTEDIENIADVIFNPTDISAPPASGSHLFDGMIICPCSLSTVSKIANGISDCLLTRAAAVCLKERRKLVLVPRETPLSTIYLRNMQSLSSQGAVILPPSPAFYHSPETIEDLVNFVVGKIMDNFGIENNLYKRWNRVGN